MNERIRKLAEQAGFVFDGETIDWSSDYTEEFAKFAEYCRQDVLNQITVVSNNKEVVAVTLTDEDHRILDVVWKRDDYKD